MVKNYNCFSVESLYTFSIGFLAKPTATECTEICEKEFLKLFFLYDLSG